MLIFYKKWKKYNEIHLTKKQNELKYSKNDKSSTLPRMDSLVHLNYKNLLSQDSNVPRYTCSSVAFAMNATDHTNVVFRKSAYSLMSWVTNPSNGIATAIVNSDAYLH